MKDTEKGESGGTVEIYPIFILMDCLKASIFLIYTAFKI